MTAKSKSLHRMVKQARRVLNSITDGPAQISGKRLTRHGWGTGVKKRGLVGPDDNSPWEPIDEEIEQLGDPDDPEFWENRKNGPEGVQVI